MTAACQPVTLRCLDRHCREYYFAPQLGLDDRKQYELLGIEGVAVRPRSSQVLELNLYEEPLQVTSSPNKEIWASAGCA